MGQSCRGAREGGEGKCAFVFEPLARRYVRVCKCIASPECQQARLERIGRRAGAAARNRPRLSVRLHLNWGVHSWK